LVKKYAQKAKIQKRSQLIHSGILSPRIFWSIPKISVLYNSYLGTHN
jgi:hypothetical protein